MSQPPRSKSALERLVAKYAERENIAVKRVMRWISFMVLSGALERLRADDGSPAFVLKGGLTLEMRLGLRARATKDLDAVFRYESEEMVHTLDEALRSGYGDWTFARAGEPQDIGKAQKIFVRIFYKGKSWATAQLEISLPQGPNVDHELVPAIQLQAFGLAGPEFLPCLPLPEQIAQKIHAMTEPPASRSDGTMRENERFRDLLDLFILRELVATPEAGLAARAACERIFALRGTHTWPPSITVYSSWPDAFAKLASEVGLPTTDVYEAREAVQAFIDRLRNAGAPPR